VVLFCPLLRQQRDYNHTGQLPVGQGREAAISNQPRVGAAISFNCNVNLRQPNAESVVILGNS
jgi:hypothetical protein